jgi:hypothetical protein
MLAPDNAVNGGLQIRIRIIFGRWICVTVSWIRIRIKIRYRSFLGEKQSRRWPWTLTMKHIPLMRSRIRIGIEVKSWIDPDPH